MRIGASLILAGLLLGACASVHRPPPVTTAPVVTGGSDDFLDGPWNHCTRQYVVFCLTSGTSKGGMPLIHTAGIRR